MSRNIYTIFALAAATLVAFSPSLAVRAEELPCDLNHELTRLENIRTAREEAPHSIDVLREELLVRKDILRTTVECGMHELDMTGEKVRSVTPRNERGLRLRDDMLLAIEEGRRYYQLRNADISHLGLQGTREFSRTLLGWREANLFPLTKRVEVFLVWHQNQPFFEKTRTRFSAIRNFLEPLPPGQYAAVRTLLSEAEGNLYRAEEENNAARELLEKRVGVDALPHLYTSLQLLSQVYEDFLALGEAFTASP